MPQLNPEFFISQLFWLTVTFLFLLLFLWRISLPRISEVLEKRETKINNDIEEAKKIQSEAEEIQAQIEKQISEARIHSTTEVKKSLLSLQKKASDELLLLDKEIDKNINESMTSIEKNKNESLNQIGSEIVNITKLILTKLTKITVNEDEIKKSISSLNSKVIN